MGIHGIILELMWYHGTYYGDTVGNSEMVEWTSTEILKGGVPVSDEFG